MVHVMSKIPKTRLRRYQRGAETVEFMVTFLLFVLVMFLIVDFAITVYDRGTVVNAAREGNRQASLFWIDPVLFDPLDPTQNQRFKRSMVDTVMTWTENNLLIDPNMSGINLTLQINNANMTTPTQTVSEGDVVSVDLQYGHNYIGLGVLAGATDPVLTSQSGLGVE